MSATLARQLVLDFPQLAISPPSADSVEENAVGSECPELFALAVSGKSVVRRVNRRNGGVSVTPFSLDRLPKRKRLSQADLADLADGSFLRSTAWPKLSANAPSIRTVDLFSGCGIMSLGAWEAARAVGMRLDPVFALDTNQTALGVYKRNFPDVIIRTDQIERALDGEFGAPMTESEQRLIRDLGKIDLLIGGPPCQGHSNLNNHTRRNDPKNRLYERMARFAELARPRNIVVENVSAVLHDQERVVDRTIAELVRLGYAVDQGLAEVALLGVAQRRRRHVLIASLDRTVDVDHTLSLYSKRPRSVRWAIGDLANLRGRTGLNAIGNMSSDNQKRAAWLFRHDKHDLPDRLRPKCHSEKEHSYKSVYGRMYWETPSQTVTGGFTSMGQGRFIHPGQPRTITPHEAARLQFIPDFFRFDDAVGRTALSEMIANAVPPKLTYVFVLELFR